VLDLGAIYLRGRHDFRAIVAVVIYAFVRVGTVAAVTVED